MKSNDNATPTTTPVAVANNVNMLTKLMCLDNKPNDTDDDAAADNTSKDILTRLMRLDDKSEIETKTKHVTKNLYRFIRICP